MGGIKASTMRCKHFRPLNYGNRQILTRSANSVDDSSIRYVAEENVEIIEPGVPTSLISLAGRYFKRWDRENHTFVSNVRDEYPDD